MEPGGYDNRHTPYLDTAETIHTAATEEGTEPNKNGAEAPKPGQLPTPCHSMPAMSNAGKSRMPSTALYVPYAVAAQVRGHNIGYHRFGGAVGQPVVDSVDGIQKPVSAPRVQRNTAFCLFPDGTLESQRHGPSRKGAAKGGTGENPTCEGASRLGPGCDAIQGCWTPSSDGGFPVWLIPGIIRLSCLQKRQDRLGCGGRG